MADKQDGPGTWPKPTMSMADAERVLDNIMVDLLRFQPFFGYMLCEVDKQIDPEEQGAYCRRMSNRIQVVIGLAMFENMEKGPLTGVLIHELMHCMLDVWSRLGSRNPRLFNVAQDLVINEMIAAEYNQYRVPDWALYMDVANKNWGTHLKPEMSSEEVYDILYKEAQKNPQGGGKGKGQSKGLGKGQPGSNSDGNGDDYSDATGGAGRTMEAEKNMRGQGMDESDGELAREALRYVMRKAAQKAQGNIPQAMKGIIEEWLKSPEIPWQRQLMYYTGQARKGLHNLRWRKPNRRYGETQRGKTPGRALGVGCVFDTSGSMSDEEIAADIAELQGIQRAVKTHILIAHADAEVQAVFELRPHDKVKFERHGCGGTDFRPAIKRFENDPKIDVIIYFTDLMGSFPEHAPVKPVLWVTGAKEEAPYGRTIRRQKDAGKD